MSTNINLDPVALTLGPLTIYWYGVMYLLGFLGAYAWCYRKRHLPKRPWEPDQIMDLFFYAAVGVIFGGSFGYLLFYSPEVLLKDPLQGLRFWEAAGRSFHGGMLGVFLGVLLFCRVHQRRFFEVTDFIALAVPIGLATGRLGNFINGELWGRVTDLSWGVIFPQAGSEPRHPSQLYEFFLEGIVLFILLNGYARKPRPNGAISGLFLIGYGFFRFCVEFLREPDKHRGFIAFDWMTIGQILSLPMIVVGIIIFVVAHYSSPKSERLSCNNI